jgi:hypothetical protein
VHLVTLIPNSGKIWILSLVQPSSISSTSRVCCTLVPYARQVLDKFPQPNCSMQTTRASTCHSSNVRSTFTSGKWRHQVLNIETRFMIKEEFKHLEATRWAFQEFKRQGLTSLFHPAPDMAYQRHFRLLYQNLSYDCERPGVLSTSLDGVDIKVTPSKIALALGCPHECPPKLVKWDITPRYGSPLSGLTV